MRNQELVSLVGLDVVLLCVNYIYAGRLVSVSDSCVVLDDAKIVYETGEWAAKAWKDAQAFPAPLAVRIDAIESFGVSGK